MVATVNPCGFALLPAYLSAFVGLQDRPGKLGAVGRALAVSAVLTAGLLGFKEEPFFQGDEKSKTPPTVGDANSIRRPANPPAQAPANTNK